MNNFATEGESIPAPVTPTIAPTNSPSIDAKSLPQEPQESLVNKEPQEALVNNEPPSAGATDPAPQTPSGSSTTPPTVPPASPLTKTGPTLGKVTEDGNMFTPNPSTKTTAPKKNLLTELTDALTGFFSPKKEPESSTPKTEPDNSAPTGSTPQSEGQPSNAAA